LTSLQRFIRKSIPNRMMSWGHPDAGKPDQLIRADR
jgi:hypothetical protein